MDSWKCLAAAAMMLVLPLAMTAPAEGNHASTDTYTQPVWFEWDRAHLNIVIVPPNHGQLYNGFGPLGNGGVDELTLDNSYLDAIEDSVEAWRDAVTAYGEPWLKNGLVLNHYVLGRDAISPWMNIHIVVTTDETKGPVLGVAVSSRPCIADMSKAYILSFTENDMFNVAAHEIGHCLGLDHVDHEHPPTDTLAAFYAYNPSTASNPRLCPSNLNVFTLEGVFAGPLGPSSARGQPGVVDWTDYDRLASC